MASERFFVTGGNIPLDAASYVVRNADGELLSALLEGEFCYMLDSRQVGKSSLMVRAVRELTLRSYLVCVIDLQGIGNTLDQTQWYLGLLDKIARTVGCEDEVEATYSRSALMSPFQRWMAIFDYVILPKLEAEDKSLVVFVDEIDIVRSLKFSTDEFFLGIREFHNRRSTDPRLNRLTFCLLGSAAPADLIQEKTVTPFNIGHRIELTDFTEAEAMVLARGFSYAVDPEGIVKSVLGWTGGHPYLTQKLCAKCVEAHVADGADVVATCEQVFFTKEALESEPNLSFACNRILRASEDSTVTLLALRSIRGSGIVVDESSDAHATLLLSGVVRSVVDSATGKRVLRIRNAIYRRVFDDEWIDSNLPEREVRREQAVQATVAQVESTAKSTVKRGLLIAAGVGVGIVGLAAAILYPVFAAAKMNARRTASLSNMKIMGTSLALYVTDYDDVFPDMSLVYESPTPGGATGLADALMPYAKDRTIFSDYWQKPFKPNEAISHTSWSAIDDLQGTALVWGTWLPDDKTRQVMLGDTSCKWFAESEAQALLQNSTREKLFPEAPNVKGGE